MNLIRNSRLIKIISFIKQLKKEIQNQSAISIEKRQRDIVTSIDKFLNLKLESFFKAHFKYPVLSEEAENKIDFLEQEGYYWIVDPLDGTVNYYRSIPVSCISVALWWKQQPIMGIVVDLNSDEVFLAVVEKNDITDQAGVWLNERPIRVSSIKQMNQGVVVTGLPAEGNFETDHLLRFVNRFQEWQKVRLFGSAALSLAWVGCGRVDAYVEDGIHIWDVAAGLAIVKAAGGEIGLRVKKKMNFVTARASNGKIPLSEI